MYRISEEHLTELANLFKSETNLPMNTWTEPKGYEKHGPRLKVQRNYSAKEQMYDSFSVSISDFPEIKAGDKGDIKQRDVRKVFQFIKENLDTLVKFYNREIGAIVFGKSIKPFTKLDRD